MRALALLVRLHATADDHDAADAALAEFLSLYSQTDYSRALVRAGERAWAVLERFADRQRDATLATAAERILAMGRNRVTAQPHLTVREQAVLRHLGTKTDKRIAADLGLSVHGVRCRIRSIFAKLGVRRRDDAVRRAHALGLLQTHE